MVIFSLLLGGKGLNLASIIFNGFIIIVFAGRQSVGDNFNPSLPINIIMMITLNV